MYRENGQRNFIIRGLDYANEDDMILISDVDEIPNLKDLDFSKITKKLFSLIKICFITNLISNYQINLDWYKRCRKNILNLHNG